MQLVRRWLWIAISLAIASAAALIFLPIAIVSDPLLRQIGYSLGPGETESLLLLFIAPNVIAGFAGGVLTIAWMVSIAICVAPVTIAGVIGEAAGMRTIIWYVGATGVLAGSMPWIMRAARGSAGSQDSLARAAELRIALIFFLTGVAAGAVYWLAAGRSAGASARRG